MLQCLPLVVFELTSIPGDPMTRSRTQWLVDSRLNGLIDACFADPRRSDSRQTVGNGLSDAKSLRSSEPASALET